MINRRCWGVYLRHEFTPGHLLGLGPGISCRRSASCYSVVGFLELLRYVHRWEEYPESCCPVLTPCSSVSVKPGPTNEPQPVIHDPVVNVTLPFNLSNPEAVPTSVPNAPVFPRP